MISNKFRGLKPKCPRCLSMDTRADEKHSSLKCKRCGYPGHWKQFFEGQEERRRVQELFSKGVLGGDPLLGSKK